METIRMCKQCLQPLPENAAEGLCPACLAKAALGSDPVAPGARVAPDIAQLAPQFPQLEIIELLGMGGMGMVYKARQPRLDRFVALKILPVESQQHPSFAERFSREAKALAKLNHPGIVNVYDFGQTDQFYYFVMEYVDGMNLRELLNKEKVTPHQALELVIQICTALQYAHDKSVVHRDIKPENIMINKEGQVKIADFGLAKLLGAAPDTDLTMSQAAMGTMNYMAPEQRLNAQAVDHRADIYSLGVVFYEMLTGEVPMGRFDPPSKRVQVDVRLDEVVLRALEREPARRYQQASEIKSNVENITSTAAVATPTSPVAPGATIKASQETRRSKKAVGVLMALSVIPLVIALLAGAAGKTSEMITILAAWGVIMAVAVQLLSRQQIYDARKRGLWPQLGEVPTLDHVMRLARSGEKILAIRLYRQFHPASLAEARAVVDKLAGPVIAPAPTQAPGASSGKLPRWFWLWVYGLFTAGWLVTKMLWNLRGPGCCAACIGMAALVVWVSLKRMRLFPEQSALYHKITPYKRWFNTVPCFVFLTCGFIFLISAFYSLWEIDPMHGNLLMKSAAEYETQYKGKEYQAIRNLAAFSKDIPNVEMIPESWNGPGLRVGWWPRPPGNHDVMIIPNLLEGGLLLVWIPFCLIGLWRVPGMPFFPFSWRHARASLAVSAAVLGSALPVFIFAELTCGSITTQSTSVFCSATPEAVTQAIQKWAGQNGYAMGPTNTWIFNTVPKGTCVAEARLRQAWKPSPFDRWQSTWTSFRPLAPRLCFEMVSAVETVPEDSKRPHWKAGYEVVSSTGPPQTIVMVSCSLADQIPPELLDILRKL